MKVALARGLRRVVDLLQRDLFEVVAAPLASAEPAPALSRHPQATREIVLDGRRVAFLLRRSRRRSIGFVVGLEGLAVSAPKSTSLREIDAAVREKARWIIASLTEQRERAARIEARRIVWQDGCEIPFLGRPVRVAIDRGPGLAPGEIALESGSPEATAEPDAGTPRRLRVGLAPDASAERLRDAVQGWLQGEARRVFEMRCQHFAERLGVTVKRLSLSSAQTRWGSANANGTVRLHWRLVHFPMATIDYVVAHELAHLREMNHGKRFWEVVRSVVPDYEAARRALSHDPLQSLE